MLIYNELVCVLSKSSLPLLSLDTWEFLPENQRKSGSHQSLTHRGDREGP